MSDRAFTGVFVPVEIYREKSLSNTEKFLIVEIDLLDQDDALGCFASNKHLADHIGKSPQTVANLLTDLKKRGWVRQLYFDGHNRGLRTRFGGALSGRAPSVFSPEPPPQNVVEMFPEPAGDPITGTGSDLLPEPGFTITETGNQSISERESRESSAFVAKSAKEKTAKKAKPAATVGSIVTELSALDCYRAIDVLAESQKALNWLSKKPGRRFTRRFFTKWLDRIEKPIEVGYTDEQLVEKAVGEAREHHRAIYGGLDTGTPFEADKYAGKWPVLKQYAEEIFAGKRRLPEIDRPAFVNYAKYRAQSITEAEYFRRITPERAAESRREVAAKLAKWGVALSN